MDKNLVEENKEDLKFVQEQFFDLQRKYKQLSAKRRHTLTTECVIEDAIQELRQKIRVARNRSFPPISEYKTHIPYNLDDSTIKERWESILENEK
jgi:hypothetical protein